jgi:hypothetical protein
MKKSSQTLQTSGNVSKILAKSVALGMVISGPICAIAEEQAKAENNDAHVEEGGSIKMIMGAALAAAAAGIAYKMTL